MQNGSAPARAGAKWGYIGTDGQFRIKPLFDEAKPFESGLAEVHDGSSQGYIDEGGNCVCRSDRQSQGKFQLFRCNLRQ